MAIDQTLVALDLGSMAVTKAGELVDVLESLKSEYDHGIAAGMNLVDYNAEFEAREPLKHTDGATLNQVLATVAVGILDYLNTTTVGEDTYMEILQKVRR